MFVLLAIGDLGPSHPDVRLAVRVITLTIALSVVAHGITARPLAARYVRGLSASGSRVIR